MDNSFVIKIKNYQIIRDAKLEFVPGLNCIVGQSNNGKSAVLRAIETALFNIPRANHVTQGETVSAVGIKYQGNTLIWRRDTKAASQVSYKWNGQVLTKVGRGQPEFISQAFGIREVELDSTMMRLNFQKQMAYPFLLDKTPSQLFKFIVQSAEEDNLMDVVESMKKDLSQISISIKGNERAQEEVGKSFANEKQKYLSLKEALPVCESILDGEKRIKYYLRLSTTVDTLKEDTNNKTGISSQANTIKKKLDTIEPYSESAMRNIATLNKLSSLVELIESKKSLKYGVVSQLNEVNNTLSRFSSLTSIQNSLSMALENKKIAESINITTMALNKSKEDLSVVNDRKEGISTRLKALEVMPKVLEEINITQDIIAKTNELSKATANRLATLSALESTIEYLTKVLQELAENYPTCPYCGSSLDGNHNHN